MIAASDMNYGLALNYCSRLINYVWRPGIASDSSGGTVPARQPHESPVG